MRTGFVLFLALLLSPLPARAERSIDALVQDMTLEEKVGQMIMTSILGRELDSSMKRFLSELRPGGITLFSYNIRKPDQLRALNRSIYRHMQGGVAPFIAIDQEGGKVTRLREQVPVYPGNMMLGAARSPELVRRAGQFLGQGLYDYGFNMNLAPVLDINSNPQNPVIGVRSYSSDAALVSTLGGAFISGLHQRGVVAVGKHFPGHGDSFGDSHSKLPVINHGIKMLQQRELIPFRDAIDKSGLDVIMTAHVAVPSLHDGRMIPSTVSPVILTDLLRRRLGFNGVIMTDGLEMKGLLKYAGTLERASVLAVVAGADVLTINADPQAALSMRRALLQAVRDGTLSTDRIDASVRRILVVKARHGILNSDHGISEPSSIDSKAYRDLAYQISRKGVTLVENRHRTIPLSATRTRNIWVAGSPASIAYLKTLMPGAQVSPARLDQLSDVQELARKLRTKGTVVIVLADKRRTVIFAEKLAKRAKGKVILVNTGSPYLVRYPVGVDAVLYTYSGMPVAVKVAMEVISGRVEASGFLPVQLSRRYPFGFASNPLGLVTRRPHK